MALKGLKVWQSYCYFILYICVLFDDYCLHFTEKNRKIHVGSVWSSKFGYTSVDFSESFQLGLFCSQQFYRGRHTYWNIEYTAFFKVHNLLNLTYVFTHKTISTMKIKNISITSKHLVGLCILSRSFRHSHPHLVFLSLKIILNSVELWN